MGGLKMKHDEDSSATVKNVVLVGMLSKEDQDMCFQQASVTWVEQDSETKCIELRDKIMNIANQHVYMITPTPMDIDALNRQSEEDWGDIWNSGPPGMIWAGRNPK